MRNIYQVLILDSDKHISDGLKYVLEQCIMNFNVFCFNEINNKFYKLIEKVKIDLFIVDTCMTNIVDIIERIIIRNRGSLFLFISGCDDTLKSLSKFSGRCVFDFMSKPIDKEIFLNRVILLLNSIDPLDKRKYEGKAYASLRSRYEETLEANKNIIENFKNYMDEEFANLTQYLKI